MSRSSVEKLGLYLSVGVTLFMSVLGIYFGIWIQSDAILLDGFFNVVSFLMAVVTLWVAWLQQQPESARFNFGYFSFVPLVNVVKGLLIFTISLFALFSAISALLHGGRTLDANRAVIYAAIAATGCLITAFIQRSISQKTPSVMLQVDAKNWLINGLISLSVGIAFGIVALIKNTSYAWFVPYADSTIVAFLVLVTLPVPIQIIFQGINQLLLGAPSTQIQKRLKGIFEVAKEEFSCERYWLRTTQVGNRIFMSIYWLLPQNFQLTSIAELDYIREKIATDLQQDYPDLMIDIIFTQDAKWAEDIKLGQSNR